MKTATKMTIKELKKQPVLEFYAKMTDDEYETYLAIQKSRAKNKQAFYAYKKRQTNTGKKPKSKP